jgi:quercetin dioxygenase-like cupin family protein
MNHETKPTISECCKIPKGWGYELIIVNNEKYCGKILHFKKGCKFSMHYHLVKHETWYVNKGVFCFHWIDTLVGKKDTNVIKVGDVIDIPIGMPHQLEAMEDGEIFEISTQHFDHDSYRIFKGD